MPIARFTFRSRESSPGPPRIATGKIDKFRVINRKSPQTFVCGLFEETPAMTDSRARGTTMGPGCLTAVFGMGTGVAIQVCSPGSSVDIKMVAVRVGCPCGAWAAACVPEQGINAVKRLAVSTGQLRRLPALHTRPIDLVVFQEPTVLRHGDLIWQRVSRLDAFSVYPGRT
jgi:hypothetical protein